MNVNYGLFPALDGAARASRGERHERLSQRALAEIAGYAAQTAPAAL